MEEKDIHPKDEMEGAFDEIIETLPNEPQGKIPEPEPEEPEDYFGEYQDPTQNYGRPNAPLMFDKGYQEDNIFKWQLQVDWTRIEQIIRGYQPKTDDKGNEYFESIKDHFLNEKGVNEILNILSFYISKEIFLSAYTEKQADLRIKQFSAEFNDFVFDNLEELGMNTQEKKKKAKMLVLNVINLVDASYSRAVGGEERRSLRQNIHITQSGNLDNHNRPEQNIMPQKKGMFARVFS